VGRWRSLGAGLLLIVMLFGWFGTVIHESVSGFYNAQVDRSFRQGMVWFIASEVLFFAAFFGALVLRASRWRCHGWPARATTCLDQPAAVA
jgi:heme/copper-type cytochrome/quinol oxidase subunit 3